MLSLRTIIVFSMLNLTYTTNKNVVPINNPPKSLPYHSTDAHHRHPTTLYSASLSLAHRYAPDAISIKLDLKTLAPSFDRKTRARAYMLYFSLFLFPKRRNGQPQGNTRNFSIYFARYASAMTCRSSPEGLYRAASLSAFYFAAGREREGGREIDVCLDLYNAPGA